MDIKELIAYAQSKPARPARPRASPQKRKGGVITHKGYFSDLSEASAAFGIPRCDGSINIKVRTWRFAEPDEEEAKARLHPLRARIQD